MGVQLEPEYAEALPLLYSPEAGSSYEQERTRLTRAQANHEELRVKEKDGSLIQADAVREMMMGKVMSARAKLLGLPSRIAPAAMAANTLREVEDAVRDIIYEALNDLADEPIEDQEKRFGEFEKFTAQTKVKKIKKRKDT